MAQHTPVEVTHEQIQRAQTMWHNVTQITKWSIIGVIVILAILALAFINW